MDRRQSWNEPLDKDNILLIRILYSEDFKSIDEFAIVYCAIKDNASHEIIRYDCSKDEAVNVHQFFKRPPVKRYLGREKNWGTIYDLIADIRRNWRIYRSEYFR